jgi:exodeoxyribonuclease V alpha subunit
MTFEKDRNQEQIEEVLKRLQKSSFRNHFSLKEKDIAYIQKNGLPKIKEHGYDFIHKRLAPAVIENDGKQTPMRGHPIFIAQHATACCCRGCLEKWHKIPKGRCLTNQEIDYIVDVLMTWIEKEYQNNLKRI